MALPGRKRGGCQWRHTELNGLRIRHLCGFSLPLLFVGISKRLDSVVVDFREISVSLFVN